MAVTNTATSSLMKPNPNATLEDVTLKQIAGAMTVKGGLGATTTKITNIKGGTSIGGFALPKTSLEFIADKIYEGNPLDMFTSGLKYTAAGVGAVEITYEKYNSVWTDKTQIGDSGDYDIQEFDSEIIKWNTSQKIKEAVSADDLSKGAPNHLAKRLTIYGKGFSQKTIMEGYKLLVKAGADKKTSSALTKTTAITQADAAGLLNEIVKANTAYLKTLRTKGIQFTGYTRADIVNVIQPEVMDTLSLAGLLGNKVEQTFANGRFTIATVGGYRVVSGDFFLPAEANAGNDLYGLISTNDVLAFNIKMLAYNVERIAPTNDIVSYSEAANLIQVTQRAKDNDMIHLLVKTKIV